MPETGIIQAIVQGGTGVAVIYVVSLFLRDRADDRRDRTEERAEFMRALTDFNRTINRMVGQCEKRDSESR